MRKVTRKQWLALIGIALFMIAVVLTFYRTGEGNAAKLPVNLDVDKLNKVTTPANPAFGHSLAVTTSGLPVSMKQFASSESCKSCHADAYKEWDSSMHARSAARDVIYEQHEETFAVKEKGDEFVSWCAGCHTPTSLVSGNIGKGKWSPRQSEQEGSSCLFCHTISGVNVSEKGIPANSSYVSSPEQYHTFNPDKEADDMKKALQNYLVNVTAEEHKAQLSKDFYRSAEYCATCHSAYEPETKKWEFDTYSEWKSSPYNTGNPQTTKTCISCHMASDTANPDLVKSGRNALYGALQENKLNHRFVGSNQMVPLMEGDTEQFELVESMLKSAAALAVEAPQTARPGQKLAFKVKVTNVGAGHYLPTGTTDIREMWIDVKVKDEQGKVLYHSGKLDQAYNVDPKAVMFNTVIADKNGDVIWQHRFWALDKVVKDFRIPPKQSRYGTYEMALPASTTGPVTIEATLRYRVMPQRLADIVLRKWKQPEDRVLPITDMASAHAQLKVR